jgi:hypothetical protein
MQVLCKDDGTPYATVQAPRMFPAQDASADASVSVVPRLLRLAIIDDHYFALASAWKCEETCLLEGALLGLEIK